MATTIHRLPVVKARTGLSRSSIYLRIAEGTFPKPVRLGRRAVGWVEALASMAVQIVMMERMKPWVERQVVMPGVAAN
jgi:prophage regulatory protein